MTIRYYQEFVIDINRLESAPIDQKVRHTKFSVKVLDSPMGESTVGQVIDIGDWGKVDQWLEGLDKRTISQTHLEEISRCLGEWLLPGGLGDLNATEFQDIFTVRKLFDSSLGSLASEEGMRIRLRLAPELAELPWEFASIIVEGNYGSRLLYLGTHEKLSIVRHEIIAGKPRKEFGIVPRIKVVYAMASPADFKEIDIYAEQERRKKDFRGLGSINVHYVPDFDNTQQAYGATKADITASLEKEEKEPTPDIFHFTGHGVWDRQGYILLTDPETNSAEYVSGADLAEWLKPTNVRLVILECCESAKNKRIVQKNNNVAIELLNQGIPAVIGMQYEIYYNFATVFTQILYQYLVAGLTIDEGVTQGRKKVKENEERSDQISLPRAWGTPILYLRNSGGNFFPPDSDRQKIYEALPNQIKWDASLSGIVRRSINDAKFLASISQLDELQAAGDNLTADPLEVLLLLKSAIHHGRNIHYWTGMLAKRGQKLLAGFQGLKIDPSRKKLDLVEKILGIDGFKIIAPPDGIDNLSWSAATHPEALVSKTAALALTALWVEQSPGMLNAAFKCDNTSLTRRIECFGAQAEALGSQNFLASFNLGKLGVFKSLGYFRDVILVWMWRFFIYWKNNKFEILLRSLYAGSGAGLTFGFYRALLTLVNQNPWGSEFALNAIFGFITGAFISLGVEIASPLLLLNTNGNGPFKASVQKKKLFWLQLSLGALGFSLVNVLVTIFAIDELTASALFRNFFTSFLGGLIIVVIWLYRQPPMESPRTRLDIKKLFLYLGRLVTLFTLLAFLQLPVLWERTTCPAASVLYGQNHRWRASPLSLSSSLIRDRYQVKMSLKKLILQCNPDQGTKSCFAVCNNGQPHKLTSLFTDCFEQWLSVLDLVLMGFFLMLGMSIAVVSIPYLLDKLRR
jgi:hypothetical protein